MKVGEALVVALGVPVPPARDAVLLADALLLSESACAVGVAVPHVVAVAVPHVVAVAVPHALPEGVAELDCAGVRAGARRRRKRKKQNISEREREGGNGKGEGGVAGAGPDPAVTAWSTPQLATPLWVEHHLLHWHLRCQWARE